MKKIWNVLVDRRLLWLLLACICPLACRLEGQRPQLREIDQELAAAIDSGDFARSKGLIAKGADVDTFGSAGHSLLFYAAQSGSAKEMTWLLMHDASVNGVDKAGDVPLSVAVAGNRVEAAKVLLEWGADPDGEYPDPIPNERENAGTRSHPLHIAVKKAGMEMVDLLLRHGAVPNAKDGEGRTALFAAAEAGKTDVVRRLLA
ncbi:MAG: ankyrin repeat domain-containing protein, partial [Planctomycetota bacterium]|nr:ankyrin repeat domain-containing protein [Planctomycetota bacterium]